MVHVCPQWLLLSPGLVSLNQISDLVGCRLLDLGWYRFIFLLTPAPSAQHGRGDLLYQPSGLFSPVVLTGRPLLLCAQGQTRCGGCPNGWKDNLRGTGVNTQLSLNTAP